MSDTPRVDLLYTQTNEASCWHQLSKMDELARQLERMCEALAEAILDFNNGCQSACEARQTHGTLCEAYKSRKKSCPDCPVDDGIECAALAKWQAMKEKK